MVLLTLFGSTISYIYSAPPLKLKQEGWTGNYALGSSYIALPWWAGQALFGTLTLNVMVLTVLYSLAGLGIAIVNDFKSIEGDREMGLNSLPVAFGVDTAKWICAGTIDITQLSVAAYLWQGLHKPVFAAVLLGLTLPQVRRLSSCALHNPALKVSAASPCASLCSALLPLLCAYICSTWTLAACASFTSQRSYHLLQHCHGTAMLLYT